ncbi:MAG: nuclear transport factor 2 family protein [Chthoniobacterales bacterium]
MNKSMFLTIVALLATAVVPPVTAGPASSEDDQALRKIEEQWAAAYVKRDSSFADRITTADFSLVEPDGSKVSKAEYVKSIASGPTVFTEFKIEEMGVRTYGDTAVVVATASVKAKSGEKDLSGRYCFTDVFVKEKGEWKAVAAHVTPVAKE